MGGVERVRARVSFADLERAPEDGRRYELYDGKVYVVPAPIPRHQVVQYTAAEALRALCHEHGGFAVGSPIDIVFSEYDVLQPDVVFFRPERAHLVDLDRAIRHAPDLCVEILSPSTEATDRGRKLQMFADTACRSTGLSILSTRPSTSTGWRRAATGSRSVRRARMKCGRLSCAECLSAPTPCFADVVP